MLFCAWLAWSRFRVVLPIRDPHTVAFGLTRVVPASMPMVAFEGAQYSVPHALVGETVRVRLRIDRHRM